MSDANSRLSRSTERLKSRKRIFGQLVAEEVDMEPGVSYSASADPSKNSSVRGSTT